MAGKKGNREYEAQDIEKLVKGHELALKEIGDL